MTSGGQHIAQVSFGDVDSRCITVANAESAVTNLGILLILFAVVGTHHSEKFSSFLTTRVFKKEMSTS